MNYKLILFILLFLPLRPFAQTIVWQGGASGNWNNATNWNSGTVPTALNDVQFTSDASVTLDINVTIKSLEVQGVSGTDIVINAGTGTNLTLDGASINNAALRLDEGNITFGTGINLTIRNAADAAIDMDNTDTLVNNGNIIIEDFEAILDENDDGIRVNNSSLFINNGLVQLDDLFTEGGTNSYGLILNSGGHFQNNTGATLQVVTPAMTNNVLNRDAILVNSGSSFTNDGNILVGNADITRIERYGIFNNGGTFVNNSTITINGTGNIALLNSNVNANFTNNGNIDLDNADDGILNQANALFFANYGSIEIGDGEDLHIDDYGIRNFGVFENYASIIINGTNDQGLYSGGTDTTLFTNYASGTIWIDNISNVELYNGTTTAGGTFINDGGLIDINQHGDTTRTANTNFVNDDFATFINQNGGIINLDYTDSDGIRSDAVGMAALINRGNGSTINIGLAEQNSIGNGNVSDDGIYCFGNIINENGATLNISNATGRLIFVDDFGNFTNQNGGIINLDICDQDAINIEAKEGNKFLNTGAGSTINIGQTIGIGDGGTTDSAIQNYGNFENADGATINIDKINQGYAIEVGNAAQQDTFINSGIINITQNGDTIQRNRVIWVRDTSVLHNLAGGEINISNVIHYAIEFENQSELINNGTINITDYEMLPTGFDNAILIENANWENDGIIRINDPNETGRFFAHAINAINCTVNMGENSNIIIGDNMTTGFIGGNAILFDNCTVTNAGAFQIGNGQTNRIEANGIHLVNSLFTNVSSANININGLLANTNGILLSGGNFINAGMIDIDHAHRGLYCSSTAAFVQNSGTIEIGDGTISNMGSIGIFNQTGFSNSGNITTNGTTGDGIRSGHPNASFTNTGIIFIDNSAANGFTNAIGTNNPSPLYNSQGTINIGLNNSNSIANIALFNDDAGSITNTNNGTINLANAASFALQNDAANGNQLINTACSEIHLNGNLDNNGDFLNEAILTIENGTYSFTNDLVNTGYLEDNAMAFAIADRTLGTIQGVNNMGTLMSQLSTLCSQNATDIILSESINLATLNFPTNSNWYYDSSLTNLAGTFDASTNTFTFSTTPNIGMATLYFDTGNCSYQGKIQIQVQDDGSCTACPSNINITSNPSNGTLEQAANAVTTTGTVIIQNGNTVVFKAGVNICLEPNFEVQLGANFEATIENCTTPIQHDNSNQ